ncbi:hypothetical protein HID58_022027 [Brassica napus]|nr:hypothetical protein HID58_022027 [Brassica napus]
MGQEGI